MQILVLNRQLRQNLGIYSSQRVFWLILLIVFAVLAVWEGFQVIKATRKRNLGLSLIKLFLVFLLFIISLNGVMPTNQRTQALMLRNNQCLPHERFEAHRNFLIFRKFGEWVPKSKQPKEKRSGWEYYKNGNAIVRQTEYNHRHQSDVYVEWPNRLISKL